VSRAAAARRDAAATLPANVRWRRDRRRRRQAGAGRRPDRAAGYLHPRGRHRVPAIYSDRQIIREDGYGPETADIFRRAVLTSIASEVIEW